MGKAKTLTAQELRRVQDYIATRAHAARNRAMLLLTHLAGMRVGEVSALTWGDVVNAEGRVKDEIRFDLPPINRTSYFSKKSINLENDGYENKQIQRRANHWFSKASRSRYADHGDRAQTRLQ